MLKRVLSLVLVSVMSISLFACGGEKHRCVHCDKYKVCERYKVKFTGGNVSNFYICNKCYKDWRETLSFPGLTISSVTKYE